MKKYGMGDVEFTEEEARVFLASRATFEAVGEYIKLSKYPVPRIDWEDIYNAAFPAALRVLAKAEPDDLVKEAFYKRAYKKACEAIRVWISTSHLKYEDELQPIGVWELPDPDLAQRAEDMRRKRDSV